MPSAYIHYIHLANPHPQLRTSWTAYNDTTHLPGCIMIEVITTY